MPPVDGPATLSPARSGRVFPSWELDSPGGAVGSRTSQDSSGSMASPGSEPPQAPLKSRVADRTSGPWRRQGVHGWLSRVSFHSRVIQDRPSRVQQTHALLQVCWRRRRDSPAHSRFRKWPGVLRPFTSVSGYTTGDSGRRCAVPSECGGSCTAIRDFLAASRESRAALRRFHESREVCGILAGFPGEAQWIRAPSRAVLRPWQIPGSSPRCSGRAGEGPHRAQRGRGRPRKLGPPSRFSQ